jgi:organic radical activating enzyme
MISRFTKKEVLEIKREFDHWNRERHAGWVDKKIDVNKQSDFFKSELARYTCINKKSEMAWAFNKIGQMEGIIRTNEYVRDNFEKYTLKFKSITEVLDGIIALKECSLYSSDFIEERCKNKKFNTPSEELVFRLHIQECERHTDDYVAKRMEDDYDYSDWTPEEELEERIKLGECGKHSTDFIEHGVQFWMKKIKFSKPSYELEARIDLEECEHFSNEFVNTKIKDLKNKDLIDTVQKELDYRIALKECELYQNPFINKNLKKWVTHQKYPIDIDIPHDELAFRLMLQECGKWSSSYIEREIERIRDEEFLIRDIKEELKIRIRLCHYEEKGKDMPTRIDESRFWDMISVHGLENMKILKDALNEVGDGFCLAKWNQVSILLQTGQTHSCHHPRPHVVPLHEIKDNPSALHNTHFKKMQRKTMLAGGKPKECDYCWNVEDANPDAFSDRHFKSGEAWAFPYFEKIRSSRPDENTLPTYVEISFSNLCNMACAYCDVKSSSNWQHEIATHGHYPTSGMFNNTEWMERDGIVPIPFTQPNPYRDAFWKWWPNLYPGLHTFRITGGEPLLHKDTFKVLDYIIENPTVNPMLEMSINSNLNTPDDIFDEFIDKVKYITEKELVWNFTLFTSIEADGPHAEYVRDGLEAERFWNNLDKFLTKCQKPSATIMATYNLMSVSTYDNVIEKVFNLKKKHYNGQRYRHYAIILDTAYLRHPEFMQIRLLPTYWIDKIRDDVKLMNNLSEEKYNHIYGHGHAGYYDFEREKLRRVLDWVDAPIDDITWLMKMRKDFYLFINEYDKRRNKNFLETFPEMEDFYNSCKKLAVDD